jgi:hypothetical protein
MSGIKRIMAKSKKKFRLKNEMEVWVIKREKEVEENEVVVQS